MSSSATSSPTRTSVDLDSQVTPPTLFAFLHNVPPQLTMLLAELSPYIKRIRKLAEAISWKSEYSSSWLLLGAWWAVCLFSEMTFRYFLLFLLAGIYVYLSVTPRPRVAPPVTEQTLQSTVIDLSVIEALLPSVPHPHPLPLPVIARICSILYLPSLLLTYFIQIRILVAILGTILLVWRAKWACTTRAAVWRSAWVRRGVARAWSLLSGRPTEPLILTTSSLLRIPESTRSIRFLITIYENQRWWVGLDWTAALLPGERPSWCSASMDPVSPPSAFTLPPQTCTFSSDGKGGIVKRTATWTWDEGEWKVVVRKEHGTKRVEKEPPELREDTAAHANRLGRAKNKLADVGAKLKPSHDGDNGDVESTNTEDTESHKSSSSGLGTELDEQLTDNDGWVYGDNKWKAFSSSGGIGKYTRFRKWTRVALLTEVVEPASAEEARKHAAQQHEIQMNSLINEFERRHTRSRSELSPTVSGPLEENDNKSGDGNNGGLRKRMREAILKTASNI